MRASVIGKAALILLAFVVFGGWALSSVAHRASLAHAPLAEVRLASWMAGLFAGGVAATLAAIALLWKRR